jgi:hypothetical protein
MDSPLAWMVAGIKFSSTSAYSLAFFVKCLIQSDVIPSYYTHGHKMGTLTIVI